MAEALWASSDASDWSSALHSLEATLKACGKKTKYGKLHTLHAKWVALGKRLKGGDAAFDKAALKDLMGYKLTRGKMRPLMRFVEAADDDAVRAASKSALQALDAADSAPAFCLAGVGVATASLLFAAADAAFPVMSDVALEVCCGAPPHGKKYDAAAYDALRAACGARASALQGAWTPRDVELALFAASLRAAPMPPPPAKKKRKRAR